MTGFAVAQLVLVGCVLVALLLVATVHREHRRAAAPGHRWMLAALVAFLIASLPAEPLGYDYHAANNAYLLRLLPLTIALVPGLLARAIGAVCGISSKLLRLSDALSV